MYAGRLRSTSSARNFQSPEVLGIKRCLDDIRLESLLFVQVAFVYASGLCMRENQYLKEFFNGRLRRKSKFLSIFSFPSTFSVRQRCCLLEVDKFGFGIHRLLLFLPALCKVLPIGKLRVDFCFLRGQD